MSLAQTNIRRTCDAHGAARVLRAFVALALGLLLAGAAWDAGEPAWAGEPLDATHAATLTLVVKDERDAGTVLVDGAQLTIYKVASLGADGVFTLTSSFADSEFDFNDELTADEAAEIAEDLAEDAADDGLQGTIRTTDTTGTASYGTVEQGIYLIVQTGSTGTAATYQTMAPSLVSVPQLVEGEYVYDVVAYPKTAIVVKPDNPETPNTPDDPTEEPTPPENPDDPVIPDKPATPTTPNITPDNPTTPTTPTTSTTPPRANTPTTPSTTTTTTPSTPSSTAPKTGDLIDWPIVAGCAAIGLAAIVVALVAARKLRK